MQKTGNILVVDDDVDIRELLHRVLTNKGYNVTLAVGGEQAFQLISKSKPDLVIIDYNMPGMDGLAFLKRFRAVDKQCPVIMLTGAPDENIESEAKKLGVDDFLRKGVGVDLFVQTIRKFVEPGKIPDKSQQKPKAYKGYIMVVDDDADIRELLKKFLSKKGYEVLAIDNAEKALDEIKARKPNLILMDINLPGMDGLTALKKIKEADKSVSVMMISGNNEISLAHDAVKLGANDYILKPFNLEYLELTVLTKIFLTS